MAQRNKHHLVFGPPVSAYRAMETLAGKKNAGGRDGSWAACRGRYRVFEVCGWQRLAAMLLVLLILPHLLLACRESCVTGQTLGFYLNDTCVGKKQGCTGSCNHDYSIGCTIHVMCEYNSKTECDSRPGTEVTTDLAIKVLTDSANTSEVLNSMSVIERTNCSILVELRNVTANFKGSYQCTDLNVDGIYRNRNFEFGEIPVEPQNLRLQYQPLENISLWLDPVKRGPELLDDSTTWTVKYINWLNGTVTCPKQSDTLCDNSEDGPCMPCLVSLKKYQGCGQYRDQGSAFNTFHLNVNVTNKFGHVSLNASFNLPDWVLPGSVDSIDLRRQGPSWLFVKVTAPKDVDECHLREMRGNNTLRYNYTVALVSAENQSLQEGSSGHTFFQRYGFVRNLDDEEEALREFTFNSSFPRLVGLQEWPVSAEPRKKPVPEKWKISGLPFAGRSYSLSVQTKAHYWGGTLSEIFTTEESVPKEGPQLHESFASCPWIERQVAVCVVYFKDIPRTKSGGILLNHTLNMTLLNSLDLPAASGCNESVVVSTEGHNNTFLVRDLCVGGAYSVQVVAGNSKGLSPSTSTVLQVRSAPASFAARNIVVESTGDSYDISWKPGPAGEDSSVKPVYTVHHCSTVPLQRDSRERNESSLPAVPFNCVTNMVQRVLTDEDTNSYTFTAIPNTRGLTPAFFVSTATADNQTSNLLPVDCFYAKGKVPALATSLEVKGEGADPSALGITVRLPCGTDLNYRNGRPARYVIAVARDDGHCSDRCNSLMWSVAEPVERLIEGSLKDPVVYTARGLDVGSTYCVGVLILGRNDHTSSLADRWTCKPAVTSVGTTGEESSPLLGLIVVAVIIVLCIFLGFIGTTGEESSPLLGLIVLGVILFFVLCIFLGSKCYRDLQKNRAKFSDYWRMQPFLPESMGTHSPRDTSNVCANPRMSPDSGFLEDVSAPVPDPVADIDATPAEVSGDEDLSTSDDNSRTRLGGPSPSNTHPRAAGHPPETQEPAATLPFKTPHQPPGKPKERNPEHYSKVTADGGTEEAISGSQPSRAAAGVSQGKRDIAIRYSFRSGQGSRVLEEDGREEEEKEDDNDDYHEENEEEEEPLSRYSSRCGIGKESCVQKIDGCEDDEEEDENEEGEEDRDDDDHEENQEEEETQNRYHSLFAAKSQSPGVDEAHNYEDDYDENKEEESRYPSLPTTESQAPEVDEHEDEEEQDDDDEGSAVPFRLAPSMSALHASLPETATRLPASCAQQRKQPSVPPSAAQLPSLDTILQAFQNSHLAMPHPASDGDVAVSSRQHLTTRDPGRDLLTDLAQNPALVADTLEASNRAYSQASFDAGSLDIQDILLAGRDVPLCQTFVAEALTDTADVLDFTSRGGDKESRDIGTAGEGNEESLCVEDIIHAARDSQVVPAGSSQWAAGPQGQERNRHPKAPSPAGGDPQRREPDRTQELSDSLPTAADSTTSDTPVSLSAASKQNASSLENILQAAENCQPVPDPTSIDSPVPLSAASNQTLSSSVENILKAAENCQPVPDPTSIDSPAPLSTASNQMLSSSVENILKAAESCPQSGSSQHPADPTVTDPPVSLSDAPTSSLENIMKAAEGCPRLPDLSPRLQRAESRSPSETESRSLSESESDRSNRNSLCLSGPEQESGFESNRDTDSESTSAGTGSGFDAFQKSVGLAASSSSRQLPKTPVLTPGDTATGVTSLPVQLKAPAAGRAAESGGSEGGSAHQSPPSPPLHSPPPSPPPSCVSVKSPSHRLDASGVNGNLTKRSVSQNGLNGGVAIAKMLSKTKSSSHDSVESTPSSDGSPLLEKTLESSLSGSENFGFSSDEMKQKQKFNQGYCKLTQEEETKL